MRNWIFVGGAVVVAAGLAAPWVTGQMTEKHWQQSMLLLNEQQPLLQLETLNYDRGYLSSDIVGVVKVLSTSQTYYHTLPIQGQVSHGFVGSRVTLKPDTEAFEDLKELFPEALPTVTLTGKAWGGLRVELDVPAIALTDEETGETLDTAAAQGRADVSGDGNRFSLSLNWPGGSIVGPDVSLSLSSVTMQQTMERLHKDIWVGDGSFVMEGGDFQAPDAEPMGFKLWRVDSKTWGSESGQRLNTEASMVMESFRVGDESFGPQRFEFVAKGLQVSAWSDLLDSYNGLQNFEQQIEGLDFPQIMELQMSLIERFNEATRSLAFAGFEVGVPVLSLSSPLGDASGKLMVSHPVVPEAEQADVLAIMQTLVGEAEVRVPALLLVMIPGLAPQLDEMENQGLLVRDGEHYMINATLEDMAVRVNGNVIPLPPVI
ncbi:MAG: YdgA family protein [Marinobacter sp.]|nr:YdgA family protein [Marinobacter sp.]